jgi:hypothetical protein
MKEKILCAAIWYKQLPLKYNLKDNILPVNCNTGLVFCAHRHVQCMYTMYAVTGLRSVEPECGEYVQGFLTNLNRFVDRKEGAQIALSSKQVKKLQFSNDTLYSEDLY